MDEKTNMVSEKIVIKLFDQVKISSDNNTESIKLLTNSINELVKILSSGPSKKDIVDEIKDHDDRSNTRLFNAIESINCKTEKVNEKTDEDVLTKLDDIDDTIRDIKNDVKNISDEIKPLSNKVKLMIAVVSIAFALFTFIYSMVNIMNDNSNSSSTKIEQSIGER